MMDRWQKKTAGARNTRCDGRAVLRQKGEHKNLMQDDNNTKSVDCKEPETIRKELDDKFKPKKEQGLLLSDSYRRLELDKRAVKVMECGTFLEWRLYENGDQRLNHANFCKDRLCPMCSWRRSLKVFGQLSKVMEVLRELYQFVFLTLSMKNCTAEELSQAISALLGAWDRFSRTDPFKNAFEGFFRALEVTRDTDPIITPLMWYGSKKSHRKPKAAYYQNQGLSIGDPNPTFDTYNAHLHVITAVLPSYFKKGDYISQQQMIQLWRRACKVDYDPTAHIQKITQKGLKDVSEIDMSAAIAEVAKYSVKSRDFIVKDRFGNVVEDITDSGVLAFLRGLTGRRLYSYGGCFKKAAAELGITDKLDDDLVNTETGEVLAPELSYMILQYSWMMGCYNLVSKERHMNIDIVPD